MTQPRQRDGRYAEKIEVGVQRRLTETLRAALGHDGTDAADDLDARLVAQSEHELVIAGDLVLASAPTDATALVGAEAKAAPGPATMRYGTDDGAQAVADADGALWVRPAGQAWRRLGEEADMDAFGEFEGFVAEHGLGQDGPQGPQGGPSGEIPADGAGTDAERLEAQEKALDAFEKAALSAAERREAPTMPGTDDSFPIRNREDLRAAVAAYGRAGDKDKARRWIIRRARELDAVGLLPESWGVEKGLEDALELDEKGRPKWDPDKHPRDHRGRFASIGATVRLPSASGGGTGRVLRATSGGRIEVEKDDGQVVEVPADQTEVVRSAAANAAFESFERAQGRFGKPGGGEPAGKPPTRAPEAAPPPQPEPPATTPGPGRAERAATAEAIRAEYERETGQTAPDGSAENPIQVGTRGLVQQVAARLEAGEDVYVAGTEGHRTIMANTARTVSEQTGVPAVARLDEGGRVWVVENRDGAAATANADVPAAVPEDDEALLDREIAAEDASTRAGEAALDRDVAAADRLGLPTMSDPDLYELAQTAKDPETRRLAAAEAADRGIDVSEGGDPHGAVAAEDDETHADELDRMLTEDMTDEQLDDALSLAENAGDAERIGEITAEQERRAGGIKPDASDSGVAGGTDVGPKPGDPGSATGPGDEGSWGTFSGQDDGVDRSSWSGGQAPMGADGQGTRPDGSAWGTGWPEGDPRLDPAYDQYTTELNARLDAKLEEFSREVGGTKHPGDTRTRFDLVLGADGKPVEDAYVAERRAAHEAIIDEIMGRYADVPRDGRAIVMAGPPGAGKSTVIQKKGAEFGVESTTRGTAHPLDPEGRGGVPTNYAVVNPDDMKEELVRRGLVPGDYMDTGITPAETAAFVHEESSWLAEMLLTRLKADGVNVILDGTFAGKPDKQVGKVKGLREVGYNVTGVLVDGTVERSLSNAAGRHRKAPSTPGGGYEGRYVPIDLIKTNEPVGVTDSVVFGRPHRNRSSENIERVQDQFDGGVLWYDNAEGDSRQVRSTVPEGVTDLVRRTDALRRRIARVQDPAERTRLERELRSLDRQIDMDYDSLAEAWVRRGGAELEAKVLEVLAAQPAGSTPGEVMRTVVAEAKAGGADRNRGNAERLRHYWVRGAGAAKIGWGTDGDWTRCVELVSEHMDPERAKGYCQLRHMEATGEPAGHRSGKSAAGGSGGPTLGASVRAGETGVGDGEVVTVRADDAGGVATLDVDRTGHRFKVRDADAQSDPAEVVYVESVGDGTLRLLPRDAVRQASPVLPVPVGKGPPGPKQAGAEAGAVGRDGTDHGVVLERKVGEQGREWVAVAQGPSVVALAHAATQAAGSVTPVVDDGAAHPSTLTALGPLTVKALGGVVLPNTNPRSDGVMVALYPPDDVAQAIAIDGGEDMAELHVTLAYLGSVAEVGDTAALLAAMEALAEDSYDLVGAVSGLGRFAGGDEGDPFYASVDVPDLPDFRADVVDAVRAAGYDVRTDHGFTPHVTLAYLSPDDPIPLERLEPFPVTFGFLSVAVGEEVWDFPLHADDEDAEDPTGTAQARPAAEGEGDAPYDEPEQGVLA